MNRFDNIRKDTGFAIIQFKLDLEEKERAKKEDCPLCEGVGEIYSPSGAPGSEQSESCPLCGGDGELPELERLQQIKADEWFVGYLTHEVRELKKLDESGKEKEFRKKLGEVYCMTQDGCD